MLSLRERWLLALLWIGAGPELLKGGLIFDDDDDGPGKKPGEDFGVIGFKKTWRLESVGVNDDIESRSETRLCPIGTGSDLGPTAGVSGTSDIGFDIETGSRKQSLLAIFGSDKKKIKPFPDFGTHVYMNHVRYYPASCLFLFLFWNSPPPYLKFSSSTFYFFYFLFF